MSGPKEDMEREARQSEVDSLRASYDYFSKQEGFKGSDTEKWIQDSAVDINLRDVADKLDIDPKDITG